MEQKQGPSNRDVAEGNDTITVPVQMINDIQVQLDNLNEAMHALRVQVFPIQKAKVSSFNA
jgi:hypothetical protein